MRVYGIRNLFRAMKLFNNRHNYTLTNVNKDIILILSVVAKFGRSRSPWAGTAVSPMPVMPPLSELLTFLFSPTFRSFWRHDIFVTEMHVHPRGDLHRRRYQACTAFSTGLSVASIDHQSDLNIALCISSFIRSFVHHRSLLLPGVQSASNGIKRLPVPQDHLILDHPPTTLLFSSHAEHSAGVLRDLVRVFSICREPCVWRTTTSRTSGDYCRLGCFEGSSGWKVVPGRSFFEALLRERRFGGVSGRPERLWR